MTRAHARRTRAGEMSVPGNRRLSAGRRNSQQLAISADKFSFWRGIAFGHLSSSGYAHGDCETESEMYYAAAVSMVCIRRGAGAPSFDIVLASSTPILTLPDLSVGTSHFPSIPIPKQQPEEAESPTCPPCRPTTATRCGGTSPRCRRLSSSRLFSASSQLPTHGGCSGTRCGFASPSSSAVSVSRPHPQKHTSAA